MLDVNNRLEPYFRRLEQQRRWLRPAAPVPEPPPEPRRPLAPLVLLVGLLAVLMVVAGHQGPPPPRTAPRLPPSTLRAAPAAAPAPLLPPEEARRLLRLMPLEREIP